MKNQSTLWRRNTNSFPVVEQPTKGTFCTKNTTVSWTKMPMKQQWGDVFFSPRQCLPQGLIYPLSPIFLSGKRELKQRRRWRQRERQKRNWFKTTTLHAHHAFFWTFLCRHYTTTTWICLISRFDKDVNTRRRLSFSFRERQYSLWEFNSRKK